MGPLYLSVSQSACLSVRPPFVHLCILLSVGLFKEDGGQGLVEDIAVGIK